MATIAIVGGAGYVGLAYATAFTKLGHEVMAVDLDTSKVQDLTAGRCPIFEPGLAELLRDGLASGRLRFTTDYAEAVPNADFVFLCVGTPPDPDGRANLRYLVAACDSLAGQLRGRTIIVNKSTLPVGCVDLVERLLAAQAPADASYAVVSNPEFLREGSAVQDVFNPDRVVLGSEDEAALQDVAALYAPLGAPVVTTDPRSAEMIKYAANAFLATRISFINEVALICERLGADVSAVARGMGLDHRIGASFLQAGIGFGGSCFPKDVRALASMARDAGLDPSLLTAVLGINATMRTVVIDKLSAALDGLAGRTVAVLGLSFKPNTDDVREAPALDIIRALLERGARVKATDPAAIPNVAGLFPEVEFVDDPYAAAMGSDAVVVVTEWDVYRSLNLARLANAMRGRVLVDARRMFDPSAATAAQLGYVGIGHPAAADQVVSLVYLDPAQTWFESAELVHSAAD